MEPSTTGIRAAPRAGPGAAPAPGLYIHVPFCRRRCTFCDFASTTDLARAGRWLDAVEREMELRAPAWTIPFDTVYLGGGTPSLLEPAAVSRILRAARRAFAVAGGAEVTLEANPGDLDPGALDALLAAGVNRLSLGVQSFDDRDLAVLGRSHTAADSLASFRAARAAGFGNVSIDLMYGIPDCPRERWAETLRRADALGPDHVSAYALTREPGTAIVRRIGGGGIEDADGEDLDLFLFTRERLEAAGYLQFEVSSFPRASGGGPADAFESRHNRKYWEGAPYLGLGPAAHSFRDAERSWNPARLDAWLAAVESGGDPAEGREVLGPEARMLERAFLGLRLVRGLDLDAFAREFGRDLRESEAATIDLLDREGLARLRGPFLRPTPRGLAVADAIALRLATAEGR